MYRQMLLTTCISFFIIGVYYGHTDPWPDNDNLSSSVYAGVHGSCNNNIVIKPKGHTTKIHVHCIGFAHWDREGYYTIACEAKRTEKGKKKWNDNDFEDEQALKMDDFRDGVREIVEINTSTESNFFTSDYVTWKGSATVVDETTEHMSADFIKDGVRGKKIANNNINPSNTGISFANSSQTPQPGDSITLDLVTSEPYYSVSWYVKAPWDTSETGTYLESDSGDGTSTEASLTYSLPSGTMHTGDFIFAADIYRWTDMSWQSKETYTVSVSNPTVPSIPQSFTASPGTSRWSVSLSWSAPSSDGGSAITGYEYQYRGYYVGTWDSWSSWQSVTGTSTTVTGLVSNRTYEFRLRAVNSVGTSTNTDSVTTTAQ